ncbi:KTSC domain-containing protein [Leifsonia sp. NPDC058248]|uniref:KTSC domain-containing protein n=1 Tax=Leifsonia sp. NPDC058248 TaxID=3346402 RepID=UPI0036D8B61A
MSPVIFHRSGCPVYRCGHERRIGRRCHDDHAPPVATRRILELEFVSGDVYRYWVVPARVWRELWDAESAGQYFTGRIRDVCPTEKVR